MQYESLKGRSRKEMVERQRVEGKGSTAEAMRKRCRTAAEAKQKFYEIPT
jgi:hypothetical protein